MGGSSKTRSGRARASAGGPTKKNARQKEDAELSRLARSVAEIPRLSNRFQLFRVNRRQRAKQREVGAASDAEGAVEPAVFRAVRFADLPLSARSLDGLAAAGFSELTGVQRMAIPQALASRDVLAAAPTGSGKTLAFLVPLLEVLWRNKWNTLDGLGALVLAPTRELAMQIFQVLRSIARLHAISAGLVIGGKDFEGEREKVGQMNVLVATPGRMLHHMDHVAELDCSNLKMLVLDEADRILDMGFAKTLDAIVTNLPKQRQTLLFSATQTKSIKALARLSLRTPEYVAVAHSPGSAGNLDDPSGNMDGEGESQTGAGEADHEGGAESVRIVGTPQGLSQSYAVVQAHEKLSVLWSFIKTHLQSKMIVFFASGKQVRFAFEAFCKMRPGMSLLHMHGNMKQLKRIDMYDLFCRTKSAVLFATDVASRGLDFPDVEWVIQVDCPDDVGSYVHRVGRTARFKAQGRAMLLLNEGKEETFLERLKDRKLILHRTRINPQRVGSIIPRLSATVASNQEIKNIAQRAFLFYIKSVYQQSDKQVFDVTELDFDLLAKSFGLSVTPKVSFKNGLDGKPSSSAGKKDPNKTVFGYRIRASHAGGADDDSQSKKTVAKKGLDRPEDEGGDDVLQLKRVHSAIGDNEENGDSSPIKPVERKRKRKKLDLLKSMPSANRTVFTEDGEAMRAGDVEAEIDASGFVSKVADEDAVQHAGIDDYAATVASRLAEAADEDKKLEQDRVRSKHARQREQVRELRKIKRPHAEAAEVGFSVGVMSDSDSDSCGSGKDDSDSDSRDTSGDESEENDVRGAVEGKELSNDEQLALRILAARR